MELEISNSDSKTEEIMANTNQTMKELVACDINYQPLCIEYPTLDANTNFVLKFGLI